MNLFNALRQYNNLCLSNNQCLRVNGHEQTFIKS